ncbi:hypothetical protein EZV62_005408 [Acer yangbiense]|uniref:PGG domain-containing protein n=1 Tax=Acer yangbiense TaxID=1000413 RepID=A0A5C7IMA7_9ROSI|nr:hypothetical protein EZV62_005408 [Acer yangbiense]
MEFLPSIKEPYQAVLDEKWDDMEKYYLGNSEDQMGAAAGANALLFPISIDKDTAFHLAVYSGGKQPLERLLDLFENDRDGNFDLDQVFMQNMYGNTVLHEAAISGNLEAVRILVSKFPKLVKATNELGETPLFRAASFGKRTIVKYLASQPDHMLSPDKKQLQDIHRQREDGASILHAAVQGEHCGTALELLELDEGLANLKYNNGTSLYVLANTPSLFKKGCNKMNIIMKLLYICLPVRKDLDEDGEYKLEAKNGETIIDIPIGDDAENIECDNGYLSKGCPILSNLWKEKRSNKFAYELAVKLIERDKSWEQSITGSTATPYKSSEQSTTGSSTLTNIVYRFVLNVADKDKSLEQKNTGFSTTSNEAARDKPDTNNDQEKKKEEIEKDRSPLFAATRTGNVELVKMILKEHPQALEYKNSRMQNILHVAVKHRQKEILDYVITKKIPMLRLVRQIDADGYTVLHSVADTKHYNGGTRSGPAYNLQEELEWFRTVEKLIPSHYKTHRDNKDKTAMELFKEMHAEQLSNAQRWIKETSQSCSGVAVLVATVVFAAAFTVPGGTNDSNGRPILLHSPFFLFFTVMDVVSLSCSLTAVVMFLSVVTSPFELHDFLLSLPRRLTLGFALLFMSVATTMLAFTSTIVLIIHLDQRRQWTMTLICSAAFFPVSVLALTHFPLFVSFLIAWKNLFKFVWKVLPCNLVLGWLKNLGKTTCEHLPTTDKGK